MMNDQIEELKQLIEELRSRMPAHSIPPAMMAELDDLEEQLAEQIKKQAGKDQSAAE